MTLRLDDPLGEDLELVARVDGRTMQDVIRQALADHVTARRADPGFRAALRAQLAKLRAMLGDEDAALWRTDSGTSPRCAPPPTRCPAAPSAVPG